jgi:hypothetical protein
MSESTFEVCYCWSAELKLGYTNVESFANDAEDQTNDGVNWQVTVGRSVRLSLEQLEVAIVKDGDKMEIRWKFVKPPPKAAKHDKAKAGEIAVVEHEDGWVTKGGKLVPSSQMS